MSPLWRCTLTRSTVYLPPTRRWFHGLRACERTPNCLYLTEPGGDYNLPFGRWGDPPEPAIEAMYTRAATQLYIAEAGVTASDLAVAAARQLLAACSDDQCRRIGAVIYCHTSTNEHIAEAVAIRLQQALGLSTSLVLSISQNLGSVLIALRLASALLHNESGLSSVLIVAAEKWVFPFIRSFGSSVLFEDGAAAALIEPAGQEGWQIGAIHHMNDPHATDPFMTAADSLRQSMLKGGIRTLESVLAASGVPPSQLSFVVLPRLDPALCVQLLQAMGLDHLQLVRESGRNGHLGAAETIANLDHMRRSPPTSAGRLGLLWSAGLHGESAGCLLSCSAIVASGSY